MEMKLCAIYTVWDDLDLLVHSIENTPADGVVVIWSEFSNYGERGSVGLPFDYFFNWEPNPNQDPRTNETAKRNFGLQKARELGYTHFIMMDADEFYEHEEFLKDKARFDDPKLMGLVGRVKCYFKSPTLTIGYDTTLVPMIHKLTPTIQHEFNKNYPFAWTFVDGVPFTHSKKIRIDPTRSLNITDDVEWTTTTMHHMSWVRKDIKKKIRNSTARANIERSTIVQDYLHAKEGYFCQFYGKYLEKSANVFALPEITDTNVTSI
jgi:hypothetical protein